MGLNWFTEPCRWKRREVSSFHVSSRAFGGQTKRHLRTSRFECVFIKKKKSLDKSSQETYHVPWISLGPSPWSLLSVDCGDVAGSAPHLRIGESHLSSFTVPRGPGCSCHGTNVSETITPQSTPWWEDGVKLVEKCAQRPAVVIVLPVPPAEVKTSFQQLRLAPGGYRRDIIITLRTFCCLVATTWALSLYYTNCHHSGALWLPPGLPVQSR